MSTNFILIRFCFKCYVDQERKLILIILIVNCIVLLNNSKCQDVTLKTFLIVLASLYSYNTTNNLERNLNKI